MAGRTKKTPPGAFAPTEVISDFVDTAGVTKMSARGGS
ncbi:hypothetical protein SLNWT_3578 [Streptomyces albus]|uniref:Uncharacterized protein n=1 Tax=Streptomyces albus (strain ATCC 21838 / DSM 41398 / FERM P-419 / JCM 4703 / NBRC 107858) TaxID=1081613 RepID=A0A0B5EQT0_STRA4|nr:hypothetical protein SLNWT_3578 [Streptomyces albus]AOU78257.1 hypothetical protein SLNHY_3566 [Streptomyces albus]